MGSFMKSKYEIQAAEKYANGEYKLGNLDEYGQRINISIELERRVGNYFEPLTFKTGWLVYPFGKIKLAAPATDLSSK